MNKIASNLKDGSNCIRLDLYISIIIIDYADERARIENVTAQKRCQNNENIRRSSHLIIFAVRLFEFKADSI